MTLRATTARAALLCLLLTPACSAFAPEVGPPEPSMSEDDDGTYDGGDGGDEGGYEDSSLVNFRRDIRPLMDRDLDDPSGPGCSDCHYTTTGTREGIEMGGLDLTTLGALRRGGVTSGSRIVVPGQPADSAIVQKLLGTYPVGPRMPKMASRYWNAEEMALLENWIAQGAPGDDSE